MQVADALSRNHWDTPMKECDQVISPDEDDPFFPYVNENTGNIRLHDGQNLANILNDSDNDKYKCSFVQLQDSEYDADTDDSFVDSFKPKQKRTKSFRDNPIKCVNVAHLTASDSVFDKSTDKEPCNNINSIFDYSTETDQRKHLSDLDKSTDSANKSSDTNNDDSIKLSDINLFNECDLTPQNIKDLQSKDNDLKPIINYLPASQKESRKLLLHATDYILVDGILFHSNISKSKRRKASNDHYKLVIPKLMIKLVLQMCHDSPMGGHAGIQNAIDRVREHYFFQRLPTIVAEYVRSCHECQIRKTSSFHTKAGIVSFPTPSEPFQVREIDLCGPFPLSSAGHS